MGYITRRSFLRAAPTIGTAVCAGGTTGCGDDRRTEGEMQSKGRVLFRNLGSTGEKVSIIGMGCMNMRDAELVRAAIDRGVNYFDTAWYYMHGQNERVVGEVMKTERDKVFLTTKIVPDEPATMMKCMEESLGRLQTDHVDLVLFHGVDSRAGVLSAKFGDVFRQFRDKGMTRFIGVSTHDNHVEVLRASIESKLWEAVLVGYNYMSSSEVKAAIADTRKAGIGIIGMKNLLNPVDLSTWNWEQIRDIRGPEEQSISRTQALIKWVVEDENVDTTIPGVTSFEQLHEDIDIMGMALKTDASQPPFKRGAAPEKLRYCHGVAGCTGCQGQCPKGVSLSQLNRCVRYADGYGDLRLARENYRLLPKTGRVEICGDCSECAVKCIHGLDATACIARARELFA